jgi:hypothetical protein
MAIVDQYAPGGDRITDADLDDALRRVRQVDSSAAREAVGRYLSEMAEMQSTLDRLALKVDNGFSTFSATWNGGEER